MTTSILSEARANHARLEERNAVHRRFGIDPDASVRFVLEQALPLRGRVLDIGTGKGRFVIPMARHLAHVTTIDINAEEQRYARLEAVHAGVADRIRFVIHDARSLPWPAACFDAVVSWNVFHHLDDPGRVFDGMLRVLKPGGKLVLADFSPSGFRVMEEIHAAEGRRHPHPPSRFAHWRARLEHAGLAVRRFVACHEEVLVARRPTARSCLRPPLRSGDRGVWSEGRIAEVNAAEPVSTQSLGNATTAFAAAEASADPPPREARGVGLVSLSGER